MPPNALNSTLIAKYKVFLWVDSAQTVLTTCQSTSELKQHTLPAFVSQKSKDTWLKIPGILKVLCCKFSSKHNWSSTFKGGSHILETFSLQMIQGMRATEPAFKSKPIKTETRLVDFLFQGVIETPTPHHSQLNEFQSPLNSQIEKGYWTKLPNYQSFDKKQKNCLPDKPCSQVLNFINNSPRFKEQLLLMYVWQGPWSEPRNHRVFCSPAEGLVSGGTL